MAKKILVSMDERLLRRVDDAARKAGVSRSAYLSRLAAGGLGEQPGPGAAPEVRRSLDKLDRLFARAGITFDVTDAVRADRDQR